MIHRDWESFFFGQYQFSIPAWLRCLGLIKPLGQTAHLKLPALTCTIDAFRVTSSPYFCAEVMAEVSDSVTGNIVTGLECSVM